MKLFGLAFALLLAGATGIGLGMWLSGSASQCWECEAALGTDDDLAQQAGA